MSYEDQPPRPFIVLAPMDDVTDTVFRQLIAQIAPADIYMTEFTNADGLCSVGREVSLKRLKFVSSEQPLIAQLWGKDPDNFYQVSKELVEMGFAGVDINFGCPDKAVLKNGCGGAMIDQPSRAQEIIDAVKEGVNQRVPVSVKTRLGTKMYKSQWIEWLLQKKLNMLSIHLRTVSELSKVPAHWELMTEIRQLRDDISPKTAIVGNGDVQNRAHANLLAKQHGIDGVMIGRGVFHDPYACSLKSPWKQMTPAEKIQLYLRHVELFEQTWAKGERPIVTLNKFCKIYVNDFPGAKEVRMDLMNAKSLDVLKQKLHTLCARLSLGVA